MASTNPAYFGSFVVTSQVFYRTTHCFALVNLKPLLPGHVLVCSNRVVPRIKDLSANEVADLFLTVQKVGKVVEAVYEAQSLNIAIQDGSAAGQSVPHVHTHIIPRRLKDLTRSDDIYTMLESEAGDLGKIFRERNNLHEAHQQATPTTLAKGAIEASKETVLTTVAQGPVSIVEQPRLQQQQQQMTLPAGDMRPKFPVPLPDELRKPRTVEEMEREAKLLAHFMDEYDQNSKL